MTQHQHFFNQVGYILQDYLLYHDIVSDIPALYIHPASLVRTLTILRDHHTFMFKQFIDLVAVDYPQRLQRFELTYHLLSIHNNERVFVKTSVKDQESISTITQLFGAAKWYEREVWDMMGIVFDNHPHLERLLNDYDFEGHPLEKDFPLTGYKQVFFDKEKQKVSYEPVNLEQNYRHFDFESPWTNSHR